MLQSFVYNGPSIKHKLKKKIVKKFVRLKTRKDNLSKIRAQKKKEREREIVLRRIYQKSSCSPKSKHCQWKFISLTIPFESSYA